MHAKPIISSAERRSAVSMHSAQNAWDHAQPPENDDWEDYVADQTEKLLACEDAELVPFHGNHPIARTGYAEEATDALIDADDHDCELLQLVLAVIRRDHELADSLAERFKPTLITTARHLLNRAREAANRE